MTLYTWMDELTCSCMLLWEDFACTALTVAHRVEEVLPALVTAKELVNEAVNGLCNCPGAAGIRCLRD